MRLVFSTKNWNPFSWVIKIFTWSKWSHVGLVDGDYVIEATALNGVRRVPLEVALEGVSKYEFVTLPSKNPSAIIEAAKTQIGKKYDFLAIIGIGLKRDWQETDKWVCSELIAWAAKEAEDNLFRHDRINRITQEHLWMLFPLDESE